ncbi:MAG: hypothetical protein LBT46_11445 [Planctomycetaceae bacterium]|jgi:hypothetical protein|nr:hypothetical protein [Planctomycetaceae bacterium]
MTDFEQKLAAMKPRVLKPSAAVRKTVPMPPSAAIKWAAAGFLLGIGTAYFFLNGTMQQAESVPRSTVITRFVIDDQPLRRIRQPADVYRLVRKIELEIPQPPDCRRNTLLKQMYALPDCF